MEPFHWMKSSVNSKMTVYSKKKPIAASPLLPLFFFLSFFDHATSELINTKLITSLIQL